jgi:hypothetical protein
MKPNKSELYALKILSGCPDGITDYAAKHNRDITGATLYRLVQKEWASVERQQLVNGGTVWRFWITDLGRDQLAN